MTKGQGLAEYALILALIAIVAIVALHLPRRPDQRQAQRRRQRALGHSQRSATRSLIQRPVGLTSGGSFHVLGGELRRASTVTDANLAGNLATRVISCRFLPEGPSPLV